MRVLRRGWDSFLDAVSFLTVLPVGGGTGGRERGRPGVRGTAFYPLVGLLPGVAAYVLLTLPVPPLSRGVLALVAWTVVGGGLHEDGWADCLDAALAPVTRDRRLEILRDPHVGAHGLTGTVLLLLLRLAPLTVVAPVAVLVAPVVGRWVMVAAAGVFPPARREGLGATFADAARPAAATGVAAMAVIPALGLGVQVVGVGFAWLAAAGAGWLGGRFLVARLGGLNGDGYGALGLLAETAALWAFHPVA